MTEFILVSGLSNPPNNIIIPMAIINNPAEISSKPPPDLNKQSNIAYFNLPVGLMTSIIKLDDTPYEPIDPKLFKLPPPTIPDETITKAVEQFYETLNNQKIRNT